MECDDFECDDFEKTLKIIVVGNGGVGKTSMTTRYAKGKYTGNYKKTIGVDFMEKHVELRDLGESIKLMIWDTAGQEEFDKLTSRYYKGAGAVIYVFSTTDRASFDDLSKWKRKVEDECGKICQVLVQNKIDLADKAAMSRAEIEDMADYMNIRLFRTCVQDNINVREVFEYLCRQHLRYGGNGDDGSSAAVADITSLSEQTHSNTRNQSRKQRETSSSSTGSTEPKLSSSSSPRTASTSTLRGQDFDSKRKTSSFSSREDLYTGAFLPPAPPAKLSFDHDRRDSDSELEAEADAAGHDNEFKDRRNDSPSSDRTKRREKDPNAQQARKDEEEEIHVGTKIQPSKRRTHGKKNRMPHVPAPTVGECIIS